MITILAENNETILQRTPRVINGGTTTVSRYPHLVRLDLEDGSFVCGGTIISEKAVLTAAHCVYDRNVVIQVGVDTLDTSVQKEVSSAVDHVVLHPLFDYESLLHDIAVILLKDYLKINSKIDIIEIATENGKLPRYAEIVGWGCTMCIWSFPKWFCHFPPSQKLRSGHLILDGHQGHMFISTSSVKACPVSFSYCY